MPETTQEDKDILCKYLNDPNNCIFPVLDALKTTFGDNEVVAIPLEVYTESELFFNTVDTRKYLHHILYPDTPIEDCYSKFMDDINHNVPKFLAYDNLLSLENTDIKFKKRYQSVKDTRMDGCGILCGGYEVFIHIPEVTVTNQHNKSHTIYDLFFDLLVGYDGKLYSEPTLIRTTYTKEELTHRYIHSHANAANNYYYGSRMCLGSGPIIETMDRIYGTMKTADEAFNCWSLFGYQLLQWAQVENYGDTYISLEQLSGSNSSNTWTSLGKDLYELNIGTIYTSSMQKIILKKFFVYFIKNYNVKIIYTTTGLKIGVNSVRFIKEVSNEFIRFCNIYSIPKNVLRNLLVYGSEVNGVINLERYDSTSYNTPNLSSLINTTPFMFGDKEFKYKLHEETSNNVVDKHMYLNIEIVKILYNFVYCKLNMN